MNGWMKRMVALVGLVSVLLLTGCIQYDLDIQFRDQTHGRIVQRIQWLDALGATPEAVRSWQRDLTQRVQGVGGRVRDRGEGQLEVTIPFNNGADLQQRFNDFFGNGNTEPWLSLPGSEPIAATLAVTQGNWLVAIYTHITLGIDLRSVPVFTESTSALLRQVELLRGQVRFTPPGQVWDDRAHAPRNTPWQLHPGEINQIEVHFWVPSPIGLGAGAIALLVAIGYSLK
jgi:hypothetical protein